MANDTIEIKQIEENGIINEYRIITRYNPKTKQTKEVRQLLRKIYEETDDIGLHKVIERPNGIKVRLLKQPSEAYKAKMQARAEAEAIKQAEINEQNAIRKKIADKQKDLAIQELLKSGDLTQEDLEKI